MDSNLIAAWVAAVVAVLSFLLDLFLFWVSKEPNYPEAKQRLVIVVTDGIVLALLGYWVTRLAIGIAIYYPASTSDLVIRTAFCSTVLGFLLGIVWILVVSPLLRKFIMRNKKTL